MVLKIVPWNISYRATTPKRIVRYICIKIWRIRNYITNKCESRIFENRSVFCNRTKGLILNFNDNTNNPSIYT